MGCKLTLIGNGFDSRRLTACDAIPMAVFLGGTEECCDQYKADGTAYSTGSRNRDLSFSTVSFVQSATHLDIHVSFLSHGRESKWSAVELALGFPHPRSSHDHSRRRSIRLLHQSPSTVHPSHISPPRTALSFPVLVGQRPLLRQTRETRSTFS